MLSHALHRYAAKYPNDMNNKDCYLFWLENDILLELNASHSLVDGVQPGLQRAFPNMSASSIFTEITSNTTETQVKQNIEHMWQYLDTDSQLRLISC